MSALVATIEMLFTPLWSFEQFRYLCCNFAAHSHQQPDVVQGHANCLDTDTHNDCDLGDDLPQSERLSRGVKNYGCSHYRRRCRILAPCCNEVFDCRHCHNDIKVCIYSWMYLDSFVQLYLSNAKLHSALWREAID
jgi:hypothetical protein